MTASLPEKAAALLLFASALATGSCTSTEDDTSDPNTGDSGSGGGPLPEGSGGEASTGGAGDESSAGGGPGSGGSGSGAGGSGTGSSPGLLPGCDSALTDANKATVEDALVRLFVQTDETAFEEYWADPYLQHNPAAQSGVAAFWSFFEGQVAAGVPLYSLSRVLGECDLVLTHGKYNGGVVFDMLRVEDGKLVEHWDSNFGDEGPNESGHTALGGPTEATDQSQTQTNKALVLAFVSDVLIEGNPSLASDFLSESLIEHDPNGSDGRDSFLEFRAENSVTTSHLHHVIADGNFVFTMTEGTLGGAPYAFYDLYRVSEAQIVEHWAGGREVPESTASGLPVF